MAKELRIGSCPYGGSVNILYQIDMDGNILGKCSLAYAIKENTDRKKAKEDLGCPQYRRDCIYGNGDWIKE